ncbi:MAG: 2-succinyl-5-enolpyruvyl-6-hydroxy-3-cyclohexene-1-carboxylic-acid synthase [Bacteroidetes bacterium]|nr:2-succinyl-5-enolpyruvyl-6-hydroxy-3-cyclohexene-1-carboxylic-acid synthase [Bacteroidota bacterium]
MSPQLAQFNVNQLWCGIVADELARSGVRHAVISPGSRSTPMVLALASHPDITDHSVIDERAAAFFALGLARATARPVILLCTSGTAAANYYPAVCEADRARVPLLVLTADRPVHLRDSGAPQAMDQVKLYGDRVRWYAESPQPEIAEDKLRALRSMVCHAVALSRADLPGPVHLNLPFRKPLEPGPAQHVMDTVNPDVFETGTPGLRGRVDGHAWTRYHSVPHAVAWSTAGSCTEREHPSGTGKPDNPGITMAADMLLLARRPLIVAGPDAEGRQYAAPLLAFARECGIPVLAEAASQLRYREAVDVVATADLLLRSQRFRAAFDPDVILRTGGTDTNAAMQRFMHECRAEVIQLAPDLRRRDPAHAVSLHLTGDVSVTIHGIREIVKSGRLSIFGDWWKLLRNADVCARAALSEELGKAGSGFEGSYIHALETLMPEGSALFVSNSLPIRDVETFLPCSAVPFDMHFNRGVNGIDGILSTALGVTRGYHARSVLLTGDIAFLHNLNALYGAGLRDLPLTIILLNNNGGGIFELLPIRDIDPAYARHFLTSQNADIPALAAALHIPCRVAEHPADFADAFRSSLLQSGVSLIEIRTDIQSSGERRRIILTQVAEAVDRALGADETAAAATIAAAPGDEGRTDAPAGVASSTTQAPDARLSSFPLAWRGYGSGDGMPAVFLHGFTRSGRSWERLITQLPQRRCITVDLMGHGDSPLPDASSHADAYTLEYAVDRLEELFSRLGCVRLHLVGYSMGGRTALAYAARYPERLASLALISANPGIEDAGERAVRRERDDTQAVHILEAGIEAFAREWSKQPMFASQQSRNPVAWRCAMADRISQQSSGLAASLRGSGQGGQKPCWDSISSLSVPVLVAAGQDDGSYAVIARRVRDALSTATLQIYPAAGHDLLFDVPDAIAEELQALWKRS